MGEVIESADFAQPRSHIAHARNPARKRGVEIIPIGRDHQSHHSDQREVDRQKDPDAREHIVGNGFARMLNR